MFEMTRKFTVKLIVKLKTEISSRPAAQDCKELQAPRMSIKETWILSLQQH